MDYVIQIAGLSVAVDLPDSGWEAVLDERYRLFRSSASPDWRLVLTHEPNLPNLRPGWIVDRPEWTRFHVARYRGWLNLVSRRGQVSAPAPERAFAALDRILTYLYLNELPRLGTGILIHAAGIEIGGQGHLFFGPSGAGKSTVSMLAAGIGHVLSDESLIVSGGAPYLLHSTPFWGHSTPAEWLRITSRRPPLRAIYALDQGRTTSLRRLEVSEAVLLLLGTEKICVERSDLLSSWLGFTDQLLSQVPAYQLTFASRPDFWSLLASRGLLTHSTK